MNTKKENNQNAIPTGIVIAVVTVVVGLLLFVGFVAVGVGTLVLMRTRDVELRAVSDRVSAIAEAERAQRLEEQLAQDGEVAQAERERPESADEETSEETATAGDAFAMPVRRITIELDQDGKIKANGEATDLDTLKVTLRQELEETELTLALVVRADPRCLFQHVAGVLAACEQLGIDNVRVMALADAEPSEATQ